MNGFSSNQILQLIGRSRAGDEEALGQLLEAYRAYLTLIARVELDEKLRGKIAESDVVQDVFRRAQGGFDEFRGRSEPELTAWLRRILVTQLATQIRHFTAERRDVRLERRLEDAANQSSAALGRCLVDSGSSPSQQAVRREAAVLVANTLAKLPADRREVLVMRHLENRTFPEIAHRMGKPLENVKSLWRRGIKQLRDTLNEENT